MALDNQEAEQGPLLKLPNGEAMDIAPDRLLLDPGNLRLLERADVALQSTSARLLGQQAIQRKVYEILRGDERFDVDGLITSILSNGFLKHERLIVARYDGSKYLTIEGNRRLTAVRAILDDRQMLLPYIAQSLESLPCFVLEGEAIDTSDDILRRYRRATEIYVGVRHLMGPRSWEPASRYEFQYRLVQQEGWTPEQVAERFGREKRQVIRELQAQLLYQEFVKFETRNKLGHSLTYNAFAEAARAPRIMQWLGWSAESMEVGNATAVDSFFHYLVGKLRPSSRDMEEGEEAGPEASAEAAVRHLRDMLKLGDPDIEGALLDRQFADAELLYEDRRTGDLARRLHTYIRALRRVPAAELLQDPEVNLKLLDDLIREAEKLRSVVRTK